MALASYSSLFTFGLLPSDKMIAGPSSYHHKLSREIRRGSLPTSICAPSSSLDITDSDYLDFSSSSPPTASVDPLGNDVDALFFNLQDKNDAEFRSFLSLDLAETQSLRSASIRAMKSMRSMASLAKSMDTRAPSIMSSSKPPPSSFKRTSVLAPKSIRRISTDSNRIIPSPKPVPSVDLPAVPPPSTTATSPSRSHSRSPVPRSGSPQLSVSTSVATADPNNTNNSGSTSTPVTTIATPAPSIVIPTPKVISRSGTIQSSAAGSQFSRVRRERRGDALARLEGRKRRKAPLLHTPPQEGVNFMMLSDDESDDDFSFTASTTRTGTTTGTGSSASASSSSGYPLPNFGGGSGNTSPRDEKGRPVYHANARARASSILDSWLPMAANFIDLQDDLGDNHGNKSWRAIFEITSTA